MGPWARLHLESRHTHTGAVLRPRFADYRSAPTPLLVPEPDIGMRPNRPRPLEAIKARRCA